MARARGVGGLPHSLASLSDSDRRSVLLAVMADVARDRSPSLLVERYRADRFVQPGVVSGDRLRRTASIVMAAVGAEEIVLAPLVPFGTHATLGGTPQDNVVSTIRTTEVAADPTAGLALECAIRRERPDSRSAATDLAAVQRITRAQRFDGPESYAHFTIAARVTAARVRPDLVSELTIRHIRGWSAAIRACGLEPTVSVTDFSGTHAAALGAIVEATGARVDDGRTRGEGYYDPIAFEITAGGTSVGDGGFVDWVARLTQDAKERTFTSALGIDRLATRLPDDLTPGAPSVG